VSRRNPAAKGRADGNHKTIADAIRALGYPVMDLSAAGNGVEDLLVGLHKTPRNLGGFQCGIPVRWWIVVECKVPRNERGEATASQYTQAQIEWRCWTEAWPRITATSGQDACNQIRAMTA
jgi:hypothetical protein